MCEESIEHLVKLTSRTTYGRSTGFALLQQAAHRPEVPHGIVCKLCNVIVTSNGGIIYQDSTLFTEQPTLPYKHDIVSPPGMARTRKVFRSYWLKANANVPTER